MKFGAKNPCPQKAGKKRTFVGHLADIWRASCQAVYFDSSVIEASQRQISDLIRTPLSALSVKRSSVLIAIRVDDEELRSSPSHQFSNLKEHSQ